VGIWIFWFCACVGWLKLWKRKQHSLLLKLMDMPQEMTVQSPHCKATVLCLNKHPRLLYGVSSCDSDESDITSGGSKGSEWKEVADGNDIWTQTTFHTASCKGLNMHLLTKHSPVSLLLYGFYTTNFISVPEVLMKTPPPQKNQNTHIICHKDNTFLRLTIFLKNGSISRIRRFWRTSNVEANMAYV